MARVSIGLVSLMVSIVFAAQALNLVLDREAAVIAGRKQLCEAVAVGCSLAA